MPKNAELRITLPTLKVLAIFLERHPQTIAGADIFNSTKMFSGTLYPVLARLEKAGWLMSEWENVDPAIVGRPRRRLYQLTAIGIARARAEFAKLQRETEGFFAPGATTSSARPT